MQGLSAIHQTFGAHGNLTSQCCLINDRWQLKIADNGLGIIADQQPIRRRSGLIGSVHGTHLHTHPLNSELLWRAPELLRSGERRGTKEGDVYSFSIIASELLNREMAWGITKNEIEIDGTLPFFGF